MERREAIRRACHLNALVAHSKGDFSQPADCFCDDRERNAERDRLFRHAGETFDFMKEAILEKFERDGITPYKAVLAEIERLWNL
jgi:hypothetical protein